MHPAEVAEGVFEAGSLGVSRRFKVNIGENNDQAVLLNQ
jgi:hypothetical protein